MSEFRDRPDVLLEAGLVITLACRHDRGLFVDRGLVVLEFDAAVTYGDPVHFGSHAFLGEPHVAYRGEFAAACYNAVPRPRVVESGGDARCCLRHRGGHRDVIRVRIDKGREFSSGRIRLGHPAVPVHSSLVP